MSSYLEYLECFLISWPKWFSNEAHWKTSLWVPLEETLGSHQAKRSLRKLSAAANLACSTGKMTQVHLMAPLSHVLSIQKVFLMISSLSLLAGDRATEGTSDQQGFLVILEKVIFPKAHKNDFSPVPRDVSTSYIISPCRLTCLCFSSWVSSHFVTHG